MKQVGLAFALAAGGILLFSPGSNAEEPSAAVLINTCFSCHGTDGHSAGDMPSIAGKSFEFVSKALKEFKNDERDSTVMGRIAKGFSDQEIEAMARYYSDK